MMRSDTLSSNDGISPSNNVCSCEKYWKNRWKINDKWIVFNKAAATLFYYYDVLTQRLYNVVLTVSRLERYVKEKKIRKPLYRNLP